MTISASIVMLRGLSEMGLPIVRARNETKNMRRARHVEGDEREGGHVTVSDFRRQTQIEACRLGIPKGHAGV
jgi:hypothetical protein